jgi:acyl-CoA synthetase (NDP forming)
MNYLDLFFKPKSVAIVGAAHTEAKLGGVVLKNLLSFGGKVYPVNPKYRELMGLKTYPSVQDIPGVVDLGIILRPATEVPDILREFSGKTKCVIVMSSGFAEVGETALQEEVRKTGQELGFRLLGPNCMGVYNPHKRLDTFFLPRERLPRPKKGNVAIVSQSGAILSCVLGAVKEANAGVSKAVGYGNAIDVSETDLYDYLAHDKKTDVVVSYVESVCDGRRFVETAQRLLREKPLVILKAGKGPSGQAAAFSHTGRLAGRYEVFHSIVRQFGIQEATDFDELIDATKALSYQRPSRGGRICIITNGGGSGVLAADECLRQGLEVTKLPEEKKERLSAIFPPFYGINNPVDLTAQVNDEDYITALTELRDCYDGFVFIALPNVFGITEKLGLLMNDAMAKMGKPVTANIASSGISKKLTALLEKAKVPVYPSPESAVRALKALLTGERKT